MLSGHESVNGAEPPKARHAVLRRFRTQTVRAIDRACSLVSRPRELHAARTWRNFMSMAASPSWTRCWRRWRAVPGLRLAEPGEFTRRAVDHGKFDLTAAEGLADLIAAQTDAQRRQALRQYDGALAELYEGWRTTADRTSGLDRSEHRFRGRGTARRCVRACARRHRTEIGEIARHVDDGGRGEIIREGLRIALIGPPNAGKSSLLNALARRDVAIVSEIPGTTRDVIEVKLDLGGYPVVVADTAGLREIRRCDRGGRRAPCVGRARSCGTRGACSGWTNGSRPALTPDVEAKLCLTVWNKSDLATHEAREGEINISAKTGEGIDIFVAALTGGVSAIADAQSEVAAAHTRAPSRSVDGSQRRIAARPYRT